MSPSGLGSLEGPGGGMSGDQRLVLEPALLGDLSLQGGLVRWDGAENEEEELE